jgi:hypothetical protein
VGHDGDDAAVVRKVAAWVVMAASVSATVGLARRRFGPDSVAFGFVAAWAPMAGLGTLSRAITIRLPKRWYLVRAFERDGRLYEALGVRVAKAALRRGPLAVFNPGLHLPGDPTPQRVRVLDGRMREAEASHTILFAVTIAAALGALARGRRRTAGAMMVANIAMNGYPLMLQRYNRILLARRYGAEVG